MNSTISWLREAFACVRDIWGCRRDSQRSIISSSAFCLANTAIAFFFSFWIFGLVFTTDLFEGLLETLEGWLQGFLRGQRQRIGSSVSAR